MKGANQAGLTLVEVLVALAVGAVVLVIVQGVFISAAEVREGQGRESEVYHRSRVFFDRLERELGSTLFRPGHPYARFEVQSGTEPSLEFSTFASSPGPEGRDTGPVMVRYLWRRAEDGPGYELLRRERPLHDSDGDGHEQRLISSLFEMQLRCFDGEGWRDSWESSQAAKQPVLLEVSYAVGDGEKRTPFRTVLEVSGGSGG